MVSLTMPTDIVPAQPTRVDGVVLRERRARLMKSVSRIARLMDTAYTIPLIRVKVGLDAIIGLVPGVGDLLGVLFSAEIVRRAARAGAPRALLAKLVANIGVDLLLGLVPVVGDVVDVIYKANTRNVALIKAWLESEGEVR